jgi:hypothetical protein
MAAANYSVVSTLYGLYAPVVVIRGMSRDLTLVDLSLEPRIDLQYKLAYCIYGSFTDDATLAALPPKRDYDPFDENWRQLRSDDPKYWWQGLTMGRLERVLDVFTVADADSRVPRLASFGEFEKRHTAVVAEGPEEDRKTLAVAANAFLEFTPDKRPVFWRMLIVQARVYQALLRTKQQDFKLPQSRKDWQALVRLEDQDEFRWRAEIGGAADLHESLSVSNAYLHRVLRLA